MNPQPPPAEGATAGKGKKDKAEDNWDLSAPLPKLPVPSLESTLEKYLRCIKPIIPEEQYARTNALVEEFKAGLGPTLHQMILDFSETVDNWAYRWWMEDMYMKNKMPLPMNSNPGMVFPRQVFKDSHDYLRFASRLISGILDYKVIIDKRGLPIDRCRHREKGQPLCMEQYYRLFSSYRVPGIDMDHLIQSKTSLFPEPEHLLVICKNQFFVLDVVVNFTRLNEDDLYHQLVRIVRMAEDEIDDKNHIGVMSSLPRHEWARTRNLLARDSTNRDSLDMIERCIFVLCLDEAVPISHNHRNSVEETMAQTRDDHSCAFQMLSGCGSELNSCNRWYDKTMQFIIAKEGVSGLCYEHSPSEGIAVIQLIEHLFRYMDDKRRVKLKREKSICELPIPRKLRWKVCEDVQQMIAYAKTEIDRVTADLDLYILRFDLFGREFPKTQDMSPDCFIQLSLQLAYYRMYKKLVSTYESASTRRFRQGRVDNIRANSLEALEWVKAMTGEVEATDEEKMLLWRKAMDYQTDLMIQNILGYGMDCHLLALKQVAEESGMGTPELFLDESYRYSNYFALSTSQVPTETDSFMCYGPVVPDGYGAAYNPHPDYILFIISSFKRTKTTDSEQFAFFVESSLIQMHDLCARVSNNASAAAANGHRASNEAAASAASAP